MHHIRSREIERKSLRIIEFPMIAGSQMIESVHVFRPDEIGGIHRTRDGESQGALPRRMQQEAVESRLPVLTVSPQIAHVPLCGPVLRKIKIIVDRTIQRPG